MYGSHCSLLSSSYTNVFKYLFLVLLGYEGIPQYSYLKQKSIVLVFSAFRVNLFLVDSIIGQVKLIFEF